MSGASLYILACSARNRMRLRLRRLREPRYLFGALVGISYLVFTFVIRQQVYDGRRSGRAAATAVGAAATAYGVPGATMGGVLLACLALTAWVLPLRSHLLEFTAAETAFLFPSPMSRAQRVLYRILRSQASVLLGAFIMAIAYPTGSMPGRLRGMISVWLLLMTSHVFFAGVTVARSSAGARRLAGRVVSWVAGLLPAAAVLSVLVPLVRHARVLPIDSADAALAVVTELATSGSARLLLAPFTTLTTPLFADSVQAWASASLFALLLYGICVGWLLLVDAGSPDVAEAVAERVDLQPQRRGRTYVVRRVPWTLAPVGAPETAFMWKGALQSSRTVDRRLLIRGLVILAWIVGSSLLVSRSRGLTALMSVGAIWGAMFALLMGPQMIRVDLRQDLARLDWLRTLPVRGAAIVRGQLLWPALSVTALTWTFAVLAMGLATAADHEWPDGEQVSVWLAFMAATPGVVFAEYTMHNAVAVWFPAWVPLGTTRARGVEAAGQRLILLLANWIGLALAFVPGALLTAALWYGVPMLRPWTLPVGAAVASVMVLGEVWLVSERLGRTFERIDLTDVERPD